MPYTESALRLNPSSRRPSASLSLAALAGLILTIGTSFSCETEPQGSDEDTCVDGHETCPCTADGLCLTGLTCLSGLCVDAGAGGDDDGDDTGPTGDESSQEGCNYEPLCGEVPGMTCVPAGIFRMGADDADASDAPARDVCMPTFYIDRTEVTVDAYRACVDAGVCTLPSTTLSCNWGVEGRGNHPINCVEWSQAKAYCEFAGKRLPTEAEWEKAARGVDARTYPWGPQPVNCERAVCAIDLGSGCGTGSTLDVGSRSPQGDSPYGAVDMVGNVREWVSDWWGWYSKYEVDNPLGPDSGDYKVLRGGAWHDVDADVLRANDHHGARPDSNDSAVGFRCARGSE